ncbi:Ger(x)C family spore germination protein [Paenibacillus sp.]|uniref:Ger(x)C family spore germination protein n=1 Tax=Paenibacillus sp. TaxID=58172 RepID=UPI0028A8B117|nr:Ger(x)C family spore germination protein [Paenibacillus sp.]
MKTIFLLLLCFTVAIQSGCAFKDIDKRIFVIAIGVDKSDDVNNPYRVTLKLALPAQKIDPSVNNTQIISENSETITGAIGRITTKISKDLNYGLLEVCILGESLAHESIKEPLSWLSRRFDIPMEGMVALGKPNAETVLKMKPKSENFSGNALFLSLSESGSISSFTVPEQFYDFYRRTTEKGMDPYLPVIEAEKEVYKIDTAALLDKQKIKTILTPEETRVFKELLKSYPHFEITTKMVDQPFVLAIEQLKRRYTIDTNNKNKPVIHVSVQMRGIVEEFVNLLYEDNWDEFEKNVEQEEKTKISSLLKKLQTNGIDPLGFGLLYRATRHEGDKEWEQWQTIYPEAVFDVHVKVSMQGTGAIK